LADGAFNLGTHKRPSGDLFREQSGDRLASQRGQPAVHAPSIEFREAAPEELTGSRSQDLVLPIGFAGLALLRGEESRQLCQRVPRRSSESPSIPGEALSFQAVDELSELRFASRLLLRSGFPVSFAKLLILDRPRTPPVLPRLPQVLQCSALRQRQGVEN